MLKEVCFTDEEKTNNDLCFMSWCKQIRLRELLVGRVPQIYFEFCAR